MGRKLEVCVAESLQTTHITSSVSVLKNCNAFPCRLHCGLTAAFFLSFLRFSQRVLRMRFCTGLSINSVTLHTGHSRVPLASQDRSTQRLQKLCEHVKMTGSLNTSLQTGQLKSSSEKGRLGAILCNFQLRVATFLASGFIQLSSKTFFFNNLALWNCQMYRCATKWHTTAIIWSGGSKSSSAMSRKNAKTCEPAAKTY